MTKTRIAGKKEKKIFVLDTSVILYDHNAVTQFQEHDVAIPITVLEELDNFKKGNEIRNFETREFIRFLDEMSSGFMLDEWVPLTGYAKGRLRVYMNIQRSGAIDAEKVFDDRKNDHKILNAALNLQDENKDTRVTLVSKDINLRLKAKSLNLNAEDYTTGKVKDIDTLYTGNSTLNVSPEFINEIYESGHAAPQEIEPEDLIPNHYYILKSAKNSVLAFYNPIERRLEHVEKRPVYGIKPRNAEQTFAIHALTNPEVKLVTLQGVAGTGKTLLALASMLDQRRNFKQIYLARPIVPLSNKDIGYLPGDIKSKLNPYMEPLFDNLKFIQNQFNETDQDYQRITEMLNKEKLVITPLAYIRGRSLSNICFIIDEAQNLTPHEVKTIISRAGEGTKVIFTGDIFQIDTPYLDSQSNGLSYLIDRLKHHPLYAHITLEKGERSELANLANELL
jgi:PhoH-like ATPase